MVLSGRNVNRSDGRILRALDLDVVPRAGPDRAGRSIHALCAQTPRCGDHRPLLVLPARPSLQGAASPRRAGALDRRTRGGWATATALHDHRPWQNGNPDMAPPHGGGMLRGGSWGARPGVLLP